MAEIISRQEAKANQKQAELLDEPHFLGRPCKYGHDGQRYTKGTACVQCGRARALQWQKDFPDKVAVRNKKYDDSHPENVKKRQKTHRDKPENKEAHRLYDIKWRADHPDYMPNYNREYMTQRYSADLNFRLRILLRTRLNVALKRGYRAGSAVRDLGCTIDEFRIHIETQFEPGMTWDNHGEWELDHIKPLSNFDLTDRAQFLEVCHYTNIRPLWKPENAARNSRANDYIPSKYESKSGYTTSRTPSLE